jgi:hypothetical protein
MLLKEDSVDQSDGCIADNIAYFRAKRKKSARMGRNLSE